MRTGVYVVLRIRSQTLSFCPWSLQKIELSKTHNATRRYKSECRWYDKGVPWTENKLSLWGRKTTYIIWLQHICQSMGISCMVTELCKCQIHTFMWDISGAYQMQKALTYLCIYLYNTAPYSCVQLICIYSCMWRTDNSLSLFLVWNAIDVIDQHFVVRTIHSFADWYL